MKRTLTAILGAGASVDAGMPTANGLTKELIEHLPVLGPERPALYFVLGRLHAELGSQGRDPTAGADVERAITALELLADREESALAPFVQSWVPWKPETDSGRLGDSLYRALQPTVAGSTYFQPSGSAITSAVRAITENDANRGLFRSTWRLCVEALRPILATTQEPDYLQPLLRMNDEGTVDIMTLNYDTALESAAEAAGVTVDVGFGSDRFGGRPNWSAKAPCRLFKLHGSIDWAYSESPTGYVQARVVKQTEDTNLMPAVIFGGFNKLRPDGPFLDIISAWRDALNGADDLLVVGYSFRDPHVNESISQWLDGEQERRLVLVEPFWSPSAHPHAARVDYRDALFQSIGGNTSRFNKPKPKPRFLHLPLGATSGIPLGIRLFGPTASSAWESAPPTSDGDRRSTYEQLREKMEVALNTQFQ